MRSLARVAAEAEEEGRSRLDPRWDRLSAGTLSTDEEAELRALAEESDEAREAYDAFRPLDAAFRARVVRAVRERALDSSSAPSRANGQDRPAATAPGARVLPFRRRAVRAARWLVPAAAAAAAVVLVLTHEPQGDLQPLPAYTLALGGGVRDVRSQSPDTAAEVFVPGSLLTLTLTPQTRVSGDVEPRCFLQRGDELRAWEVEAEVSPAGSVRVREKIGPELEPGEWTLWAVVARPGKMPDVEELRSFVGPEGTRQRDWTLLKKAFRIAGDR